METFLAQLSLKLSPEQLDSLRAYAQRRRTPVSWLLRDYIDYLLRGGAPVTPTLYPLPTAEELTGLAATGGAFDWLKDEPNVYTWEDGEPI